MGGHSHAQAALPPGKTRYPLYRRLSWPQGRSERVRKIRPNPRIRSPDRPTRSESLYLLRYPGYIYIWIVHNNRLFHVNEVYGLWSSDYGYQTDMSLFRAQYSEKRRHILIVTKCYKRYWFEYSSKCTDIYITNFLCMRVRINFSIKDIRVNIHYLFRSSSCFLADLWRSHAPVGGLTTSVCDR